MKIDETELNVLAQNVFFTTTLIRAVRKTKLKIGLLFFYFKRAAAAVISSRSSNVLHPPRCTVYVVSSKNQKLDVNGTQKDKVKYTKQNGPCYKNNERIIVIMLFQKKG